MMELPPKSILTNATTIVSACEWAEVSPDYSNNSGRKSQPLQFVLVTELAALLHLGSYTHARHLWHRHRQDINSAINSSTEKGALDPEMDQFHRLWKAAQPLLLASAAPSVSSYTNPTPSSASTLQIQIACRQFYTQLRSSCIQTPVPQQPLATFAEELYRSQRMQMVRLLEETFDSVPRTKADSTETTTTTGCRLKDVLGFDDTNELEEFLSSRGWHLENDFWIPGEAYLKESREVAEDSLSGFVTSNGGREEQKAQPLGFGLLDVDRGCGQSGLDSSSWRDEKINFLTHIVGFMERHGMDLTASREGGK